MMEELQDALEDAQYINAILFDEEGEPRPLKAWKVPLEEQMEEWKELQLQTWRQMINRNYSNKPFEFLWTISTPLGLFIFSSFLKEVTKDYIGICFVEDVLRWLSYSGDEKTAKLRHILQTYLKPTRTNPDTFTPSLPPVTLIDEYDLKFTPMGKLFNEVELKDAVQKNYDPSCSKCCIGLDGPVRDKLTATIVQRLDRKESPLHQRDEDLLETPSSSDDGGDEDELDEQNEETPDGNPEDPSSSDEEASEAAPRSSLDEVIQPIQVDDDLFSQAVQIILENIREKYWDQFVNGETHWNKLIKLLWNKDQPVTDKHFHPIRVLGRGGFGLVTACRKTTTGKLYAMKVMDKKRIKLKKSQKLTINERDALAAVDSPFVVSLKYAFQSKTDIFLILDLMIGGDLSYHLNQRGPFLKEECLYYAARIMFALQAMHDKNYVYRDLKPENCLLSHDGKVKLTDLGLTTQVTSRLQGAAGTRGYWAPEMLRRDSKGKRKTYDQNVDWFSFGCVVAEFISGKCPFRSEAAIAFGRRGLSDMGTFTGASSGCTSQNSKVRFDKSVLDRAQLKAKVERAVDLATLEMDPIFPSSLFSDDAADFCQRLLKKNPRDRLGSKGIQELRDHPWFKDIDLEAVYSDRFPPPFTPLRDINAGTQSEIGTFERSTSRLDEKDEALYINWEYIHPKVFDEEVLNMLIFERNNGTSIVPIMTPCCCTVS